MANLYVAVGLPASGKSTHAEKSGMHVVSSDSLREELLGDVNNQESNDIIFTEMYRRAEQALAEGEDVFLDSTNISSKKRRQIVERFRKKAEKIIAVYFNTSFLECSVRNISRERRVPSFALDRMRKALQVPTCQEGFDDIQIVSKQSFPYAPFKERIEKLIVSSISHDKLFESLRTINAFADIENMPQDSKYHSFTVSRHTYHVWDYVKDNYKYLDEEDEDTLVMLWSALLHDTGKYDCKSFVSRNGISRYASFIGHENVSAQNAVEVLTTLGYSDKFILDVVAIVQNHMKLLSINDNAKGLKKLEKQVGTDVYNKLCFFREADTNAK